MTLSIIYSLFPDEGSAKHTATHLLQQKLVACCNIIPGITSLYWWEGRITESQEYTLWCKTSPALIEHATEQLRQLHPYECPAILCFPAQSTADYTNWVNAVTAVSPIPS